MVKFEIRLDTLDTKRWDWELVRHETVSGTEEVILCGSSQTIEQAIADSVEAFGVAKGKYT